MTVMEIKCGDTTADDGWGKYIIRKHTKIKTKSMTPKPLLSLQLLPPLPTQEGKDIGDRKRIESKRYKP